MKETVDFPSQPTPQPNKVEAMKDPGFHIGKIDTQTLNTMDTFGLKIENAKDENGNGVVRLNSDRKMDAAYSQNGSPLEDIPQKSPSDLNIDLNNSNGGIKKIEARPTTTPDGKQLLGVKLFNGDGSVDVIIFGKR